MVPKGKEWYKLMRKIITVLLALLILSTLACPVFAAENQFVPSISYKDGPELDQAEMKGEKNTDCIVITSIQSAKDKATDITQEARDLLLEVYAQLKDGSMKLPLDNEKYVIRELVDISFKQTKCVNTDHVHAEELNKPEVTITLQLDMGVNKYTEVVGFSYNDGEWNELVSVTNNGDGTLTVVMDHFCPTVFCVSTDEVTNNPQAMPPKTGDAVGQNLTLYIAVMVASLAAIVAIVVIRRKDSRK